MLCRISEYFYLDLLLTLSEAIDVSFCDRHKQEPQLIANLAKNLPYMINSDHRRNSPHPPLPHTTCGSVFVHGSQLVAPCVGEECAFPRKKPASVEIGDLLLISTIHKNRNTTRKALLLQAKKVSHACDIFKHLENPNQYHIYSKWPPIEYIKGIEMHSKQQIKCKRSGCKDYQSCSRDFIDLSDTDPRKATQYLIISENNCEATCPCDDCIISRSTYPSHCCCPLPPMFLHPPCYTAELDTKTKFNNFVSFNCMLLQFILGKTGKTFEDINKPGNITGWDILVNDLICTVEGKSSSFIKNAQPKGDNVNSASRGQGVLCFLPSFGNINLNSFLDYSILTKNKIITTYTERVDGPPSVSDMSREDNDEPRGISIIEFVTDYGEEHRKREYL